MVFWEQVMVGIGIGSGQGRTDNHLVCFVLPLKSAFLASLALLVLLAFVGNHGG